MAQLARYLRQRAAARLAPGQSLDVTLTDIRRAGNYEAWHGPRANDVRIVRDLYPPRITLRFALHGADGAVLAQGERRLADPGFQRTLASAILDGIDRYFTRQPPPGTLYALRAQAAQDATAVSSVPQGAFGAGGSP